jgi:hypothetical protein
MEGFAHLKWLAMGVIIGFLVPFVFGDRLTLPLDLYYLIYFAAVGTFLTVYVRKTGLDVRTWLARRLVWGLALGVVFGAVMVRFVLTNPATEGFSGPGLAWALLWRGVVYGTVDGLLLTAFPWVVTWRAFRVEERRLGGKAAFALLAWVFILAMTAAYHAGYSDFRSPKLAKTLVGNTLISVPTLVAANPVGAPITHAMMHVAVIIHCPKTDVFLPPHRD